VSLKKRIICGLIAVCLIFSLCPSSYALSASEQLNENMHEYLASGEILDLTRRENYSYINFIDSVERNELANVTLEFVDDVVETGSLSDLEPPFYANILVSIMALSEAGNASSIAEQNKRDNLKSIKDYAMDFAGMAADAVGVTCGTSKYLHRLSDDTALAVDGMATSLEGIDESLDAFSDLQTILQNYDSYMVLLDAVEANSKGNLRVAAVTLRDGMKKAMEIRLGSYAHVLDQNTEHLTEFFFSNIFLELLKETAEYETDDALRAFVDWGGEVVAAVGVLSSSFQLGAEIGKLIGNLTVGGEDLITRTREIFALRDIRTAVVQELNKSTVGFQANYGIKSAEELNEYVYRCTDLAAYLKICDIRGEYCLRSIVTSNAKLLTWFNKENAEDAELWYARRSDAIKIAHSKLQSVRFEGMPDEISEQETETADYSLYIPVLEKAIAERPYESDEYGILYDIDKDDVDELFMLHSYINGGTFPALGYSIYDIENGSLSEIIKKQDLIVLAGGGGCFAGVTTVNGEDRFFAYGLQVGDCYANSVIEVYDAEFSLIQTFKADMKSELVPIFGYDYTTAYSLNDLPCTEEEYYDQLNSFFSFDTSCFLPGNSVGKTGQFYNGEWYGETLEELLLKVKGNHMTDNPDLEEDEFYYPEDEDAEFVAKNSKTAAEQYLRERVLPYYEAEDSTHTLTYYCQTYNPESYSSLTEDNMYCGDKPKDVLLAYNICDIDGNGFNDLVLATAYYSDAISLFDYSGVASGEKIFSLVHGIDTFLFDQDGRVSMKYHEGNGNFGDVSGTPEKFYFFFSGKYFVSISACDFSEADINDVYYPVTDIVKWHTESLSIEEFDIESGEYRYVSGLTRFVKEDEVRYYDDFELNNCIYSSTNPDYGEFLSEEEAINKVYNALSSLAINNVIIEPTSWEQRWEKIIRTTPYAGQPVTIFEQRPSVSTFCGSSGAIKEKYPDLGSYSEYRNLRGTTTGDMTVTVKHSEQYPQFISRDEKTEVSRTALALSEEDRYRINIFLSNFSEQQFHEGVIAWPEHREDPYFTAQSADAMELLSFAWRYAKINQAAYESVFLENGYYYGVSVDTIEALSQRFFGHSIAEEIYEAGASGALLIKDGKVCFPAADGEAYNRLTLLDQAVEQSDGSIKVEFSIYSTDIDDSIVFAGSTIHNKSLYYFTQEEAAGHAMLHYEHGGEAVIRPYTAENGTASFQLVSYQIEK